MLLEVSDFDVPAFFARARVKGDQVVVGRFDEQVVVPDGGAAVADVGAAASLPEMAPEQAAVASIHGPDIVGRRDIENVVDHQNRALDVGAIAGGELAAALAGDDDRSGRAEAAWRTGGEGRRPGKRQVLDRLAVDGSKFAVALTGVVAGVDGPRFLERLLDVGRVEDDVLGQRSGRQ